MLKKKENNTATATAEGKPAKDVNIAREWAKLGIGIFFAIAGVGLVAWSMLIPPAGVIHATVLGAFGTLLTWTGAMFGMDSNAKIKMHEQDVEFEMKSKELDAKMQRFEMRYRMPQIDADDDEDEKDFK